MAKVRCIVPGGLNTDIIGMGVSSIVRKGELSYGGELKIGPGGKSRNIAQMIATLSKKGEVAMIGRSCKDPYGLWKPPIDALEKSGVNIDYVKISEFDKVKKFPGIALIPVNKQGENQIYVLPGVNVDFSSEDIDSAKGLFEDAKENDGVLVLSLELPLKTAIHSINKAHDFNLKIVLDPGGMIEGIDYSKLFNCGVFLFKPNEHEARMLTDIEVIDYASAKKAANVLISKGCENVLITHGNKGAYLFSEGVGEHIEVPQIDSLGQNDATGCGDQTMATLCYYISQGKDLLSASKLAVKSGALQFQRQGIVPVKLEEIE